MLREIVYRGILVKECCVVTINVVMYGAYLGGLVH
jgi:hypothetical protein